MVTREAPDPLNPNGDVMRILQFARDLLDKPPAEEPPILWHYTTAEGLLGMIQKKNIWMSHITCMNDSEEYLHGLNYMIGAVGINSGSTLPEHIQKLHQAIVAPVISLMNIRNIPDIFVSCFSGETDTLTHWTEYGRQGVGYAIGFDSQKLKSVTAKSAMLQQCIYKDDAKMGLAAKLLEMADAVFTETVESQPHISLDAHVVRFVSYLAFAGAFFGTVFKHAIFEPEQEWRLVALDRQAGFGVDYIARRNEIREIVKLPISEDGFESAISEIKIGSNRDPRLREIAVTVIERLLRSEKLEHVKVSESRSPYRTP